MTIAYYYFFISSLVNTIIGILLGLYVLIKNSKSKVNRSFFYFCIAFVSWSFPYMFWPMAQTKEGTLLSFQLLHIGASFAPVCYLYFVLHWLGIIQKKKAVIIAGFALATFFSLSIFSPLFISDMVPKFNMKYWAEPGIIYHFYLAHFYLFFLYASYLLFIQYRKETGIKKIQIKLLLIGFILGFFAGSTNYFLWYDISIPPYLNIFASIFGAFTAYAITRYRFMDMKIILKKSILHLIIFCGIAGIIIALILFLNKYLSANDYNINDIVIVEVVLLVIFLPVLRSVILRVTNKYINKEEIDLSKHFEEFNTNISYTTYLEDLLNQSTIFIKEQLKIDKVDIIVRDFSIPDLGYFYPTSEKKILKKEIQELLLSYFIEDRSMLLKQEIPYISANKENADILARINKLMQKEDITVIASLQQVDIVNGFILIGSKINNDIFSEEESIILKNISKQINGALARVLCYEEAVARVKREFGNKSNTPTIKP